MANTDTLKLTRVKTDASVVTNLSLHNGDKYLDKIQVADDNDIPDSKKSSSEIIHEAARFIYGDKVYIDDFESSTNPYASRKMYKKQRINQVIETNIDELKDSSSSDFQVHVTCADIPTSRPIDHIYEEIGSVAESPNISKYDILDYYEKYSPTTAKMLIDTLFLPGHKICKICAALQTSVIYSDRLIKFNKPLNAKEVTLLQMENSLNFKYNSNNFDYSNFRRYLNDKDTESFIPIYNTVKPNVSGIFYANNISADIFDLKSTLEPTIKLVDNAFRGLANTELYHRNANHFLSRVSANGFPPMVFNSDRYNFLKTIKGDGYATDLNNWMNYRKDVVKLRNSKPNELPLSVIEPHPDRSSLLLLEPLLLMPELSIPGRKEAKNRITHSEHLKIVRMMIAYTLAFFLLAIVTFYIIYFS